MIAQIETHTAGTVHPRHGHVVTPRHRAALYAVLAQSLSAPTRALCDAVEQGVLPAVIHEALHRLPVKYGCRFDLSCLDKLTPPAGCVDFAGMLMAEYTRLFALNLHCPQYEADYVSRSSFNWAHIISAVSSMYSNFGVQLASGVGERPDHMAVELDFMNLLAAREARARELNHVAKIKVSRRAQKLFFASHVSQWCVPFARKLAQETRIDFYQGIAALTESLMAADARYWNVELNTSDFQAAPVPGERGANEAAACGCSQGAQQTAPLTQIMPQALAHIQHMAGGEE
jgi:putative dimethyl sulfoxide reductase chaperone